jgi:hypothetical protein
MVRYCSLIVLLSTATPALAFMPITPHASLRSALKASSDEFIIGILGDLHMDPRKMEDYVTGREQWLPIFEEAKSTHGNAALVSLGDLGESKSIRPDVTSELFAGTTECHELAAEFLGSFGVPYEVVGGNHGKSYNLAYFLLL